MYVAPWTRDELRLKNGYRDLSVAVIKQWHIDGEPSSSSILEWVELLKEFEVRDYENV
jgi:hypothetical protein